jgi:hypothetical protein
MFSMGKRRWLKFSVAGLVVIASAFSCMAQTSRVAGTVQGRHSKAPVQILMSYLFRTTLSRAVIQFSGRGSGADYSMEWV